MASILFYLWFYVTPQYQDYKNYKKEFKEKTELIELEKKELQKQVDNRVNELEKSLKKNTELDKLLAISNSNLNRYKLKEKILEDVRKKFENREALSPADLEIYFTDYFNSNSQ